MSISAVSSSTTASTTSSTSSSSSSFSSEDFLTLLVEQLQNQNPLEPTSTEKVMDQMKSYASYGQQADTNTTLESIATKLDAIASSLDITV